MKIIIPGGTGHLGTLLATAFHKAGHEVVVLSRSPRLEPWPVVQWDGRTVGEWAETLEGADAVINLAGRSVDCRYSAKHRQEIISSRVDSTRAVGQAIAAAANPPRVWLQASTATIYAHRFDADNDELTGLISKNGSGPWPFSIEVARAWERAMDEAQTPRTRKVKLRTAMVMSPERGGPFHALLRHVRLGFGSFGDGRQYVSWIHERDFIRAIEWLIAHDDVEGVVNIAAPNPIPMRDFLGTIAKSYGRRVMLPLQEWMVKIGAFLVRTEPELVMKSRRVVPGRLSDGGFPFEFPTWPYAARELCERWRAHGASGTW